MFFFLKSIAAFLFKMNYTKLRLLHIIFFLLPFFPQNVVRSVADAKICRKEINVLYLCHPYGESM